MSDFKVVNDENDEIRMDRAIPEVIAPPVIPLDKARLFDKNGLPNLKALKAHLQREGRLSMDAAIELVRRGADVFKKEPNILQLKYPVTVCGDIHGQFFDLMRLFEIGGDPKDTQFLFLGDYVDRGCFSCEVVFYMYGLKLVYPKTMWMIRGNHECRQLSSFFNFKDECIYKYNEDLYDEIMRSFDNLPLAAIINKSFFCVHGGLSPDITKIDDIGNINRFREIPREGSMCDLVWSDPYEEDNPEKEAPAPGTDVNWYGYNATRQCSFVFGVEAVKTFLKANKVTSIIRAHEAQVDGYKMHMVNPSNQIPRVITIFSAPNYCDVYKNKAACLKFDTGTLNIKQFVDSPHPYYLPNFMDVFQWSLPFVAEKVTDMMARVLESSAAEEDDDPDDHMNQRKGLLKQKVLAVSKVLRIYKMLRVNNESILQLKQLTPNHKVPFGLLSEGKEAIDAALLNFDGAKKADKCNEALPTAEQIAMATMSPRRQRSNSGIHHLRSDSLRVFDAESILGEMLKPASPKVGPLVGQASEKPVATTTAISTSTANTQAEGKND